jgi:tetratricopeptide (TPR) repeat protein
MKTGRNEKCSCGSEKKYKKCCLLKDEKLEVSGTSQGKLFIYKIDPDLEDEIDNLLIKMSKSGASSVQNDVERIFDENSDNAIAQYMMGVFLSAGLKKSLEAIPYYEKSIEMYPTFAFSYYNLGVCYMQVLDFAKMKAAFKNAIRLDTNGEIGYMAREQLKNVEDTIKSFSTSVSLDDHINQERLFENAFQTMKNKQYDEAIRLFSLVLAKDSRSVQSYGNLGLCYAYQGQKQKALDHFYKALEIDPTYEVALINKEMCMKFMVEGQSLVPDNTDEVKYYRDFGAGKKSYIESFMNDISL